MGGTTNRRAGTCDSVSSINPATDGQSQGRRHRPVQRVSL